MPAFHATLALPNLTPRDTWEYMDSPEHLAQHLAREEGVILSRSMRSSLHADATIAEYGDLHVDHLPSVFHLEVLRRDTAEIDTFDATARAALSADVADIGSMHTELGGELQKARVAEPPNNFAWELIGSRSLEEINYKRFDELAEWPGNTRTRVINDAVGRALSNRPIDPEDDDWLHLQESRRLLSTYSTDMSRARMAEWAAADPSHSATAQRPTARIEVQAAHAAPPIYRGIRYEAPRSTPRPSDPDQVAMTERGQQNTTRHLLAEQHDVDRGIRCEPTPPRQATPMEQQHPQPRRIEHFPSHTMDHRRPSM
nr:YjbH domain-containing protein [Rhodococcus sp. 06-1059B-a]